MDGEGARLVDQARVRVAVQVARVLMDVVRSVVRGHAQLRIQLEGTGAVQASRSRFGLARDLRDQAPARRGILRLLHMALEPAEIGIQRAARKKRRDVFRGAHLPALALGELLAYLVLLA